MAILGGIALEVVLERAARHALVTMWLQSQIGLREVKDSFLFSAAFLGQTLLD